MRKTLSFMAMIFWVIFFWAQQAQSGLILELTEIELKFGILPLVTTQKTATGQAVITGPGVAKVAPMPAGGGLVEVTEPGKAKAGAFVDLATQKLWHLWAAKPDSGFTGTGTKADIDEKVKMQNVTVLTGIDLIFTLKKDPNQQDDIYFGPDVKGRLMNYIVFREVTTGTTLFDSTTTISENAKNLVTDNTGNIKWIRSPGFFGSFLGLDGIKNEFSSNRWVREFDPITLDIPVTLNAGASLDLEFALENFSSGFASEGTSLYGVSSVPFTIRPATSRGWSRPFGPIYAEEKVIRGLIPRTHGPGKGLRWIRLGENVCQNLALPHGK